MKKLNSSIVRFSFALLGGLLCSCALTASAQTTNHLQRFYLQAGGGVAFTSGTQLKDNPFGANSGDIRYQTGVQGSLQVGYNLNSSFSAGINVGFVENPIDSIGGNTLSHTGSSADLYQIPLMTELIYRPLHGHFTPYIGAGVGAVIAMFDGKTMPAGFSSGYSDTDITLGYEAKVGVQYNFNKSWSAGVGYQMLVSSGHSWQDSSVNLTTKEMLTHCVTASLTWRF